MYIQQDLLARAAEGRPVRVGLIGAGKFATMFLAQAERQRGIHVVGICDLAPDTARSNLALADWAAERFAAGSLDDAARTGATHVGDDWEALVGHPAVEIVVECTGNPIAAVMHILRAFAEGKHVVNVTVEADAFCGPGLAARAREAGVIYSMAYGDQPALTCELVDWARATGFEVVAAGKGTKYLPAFHASTPDTVWQHYGLTGEEAAAAGMNSQMFNSFLDGTKSALEMAAIANATGLTPPSDGLLFPPAGMDDLAHVLRPAADGGQLEGKGMVEVVSSVERDGRPVFKDLRWGVYVVIEAPNDYAAACFRQYGMNTDSSGRYSAMFKPFHLIGLELNISVLSAGILGRPTGETRDFRGDVVATAKRDLKAGEMLDGEGGFTVWGKLLPAATSLRLGGLPIGLAHKVRLKRDIPAGQCLSWVDVEVDESQEAVRIRREMEGRFNQPANAAAG